MPPLPVATPAAEIAGDAVSPLTLSHHLLSLAEQAHRAGMARSAGRLLRLAHSVGNDLPCGR